MQRTRQGWLVGIAVATLASGMATSSLLCARGEHVEARVRAFVAAHPVVRPAAIARRTSLWGETWDEDAGLGYAAAATMLPRRFAHQPRFGQLDTRSAAAERAASWPALAPIAEVLRRAAHAGSFAAGALPPIEMRAVLRIGRLHAADQSDLRRCVETWLDEAVLWCDGRAATDFWPFEIVWPEDLVVRLDSAAAALLATGLERLEARWPPHVDVAAALAGLARAALQQQSARALSRWRAWRHGFDPRQRELAAIAEFTGVVACMAAPAARWAERDAQWQRLFDCDPDTMRSAPSLFLHHFHAAERSQVEGQARFRLLRLALAFQLGQPLPDLVDPLTGGPFVVQIAGDVATFRSAAPNVSLSRWAKRR